MQYPESLDDIRNLNWPKLQELKIAEVLDWYKRYDLSFSRYSKSKTELALNSFTRLFGENRYDTTDLMESMIGVEALYCLERTLKTQQIVANTQAVLGKISKEKLLKSMYNFRSRLLHGDRHVAPLHYDDEDQDSERFQSDLYNNTILAVAIVTATLQYLVVENKKTLSWTRKKDSLLSRFINYFFLR